MDYGAGRVVSEEVKENHWSLNGLRASGHHLTRITWDDENVGNFRRPQRCAEVQVDFHLALGH